MPFLFSLFIRLYGVGIHIASIFNSKAKEWVIGRNNWEDRLFQQLKQHKKPVVWFHCASLGEYLQAEPIIAALKNEYPDQHTYLVSFFSPSGYLNYPDSGVADVITYLPLDTKKNARLFLKIAKPIASFFVKYDLWPRYLSECRKREIPLFLVAAQFRSDQIYFKKQGAFLLEYLKEFEHTFHQFPTSSFLAQSQGIPSTLAGDPRFDKAQDNSKTEWSHEVLDQFCENKKIVVFGSSWEKEEEWVKQLLELNKGVKIIVAPHDLKRAKANLKQFKNAVLWSQREKIQSETQVLIIDEIGLLRYLYRYASLAVVGGGFKNSLHNIIEPMAYGIPVFYGDRHDKYPEGNALVNANGGAHFSTPEEGAQFIARLIEDENQLTEYTKTVKSFFRAQLGSAKKIVMHPSVQRVFS